MSSKTLCLSSLKKMFASATVVLILLIGLGVKLNDMSGRLDDMSGRLDDMSGRLDDMSGRLDNMSGRLDKMEHKYVNFRQTANTSLKK